jgi:small-conductance mechanosensitive channel
MSDDGEPLSVAELAEYCRTQAGLLSGRTETLGAETDALLDEIDERIAEVRARLSEHANAVEGATTSATTTGPDDASAELSELEELEADLEEQQAVAEAKRARMAAFQELSTAYAELARELEETVADGRTALDRVVRFEREHDAPAYFEERRTVLEAATESDT